MSEPELVVVVVDGDACIGAGQCEMFEEETFRINDDTAVAEVIGAGTLPRDRAEKIAEMCPSGAISIVTGAVE